MAENDVDVGLILKKAFKSIVQDPGYILLFLLPVLISIVFLGLFWLIIGVDLFTLSQSYQNASEFMNMLQTSFGLLIGIGIIYAILLIIVYVTVQAAAIKKVEAQEKGERLSVSEAFSRGLSVFPRLFAAVLLFALIIVAPIIGLVALAILGTVTTIIPLVCLSMLLLFIIIIPLIYFSIRLSLYAQACVLENLGPIDCLKRSWHITKGSVLLIFVTGLILAIIAFAILAPFMAINFATTFTTLTSTGVSYNPFGSILYSIGQLVAQLIIGPVYLIAYTLIYLSLSNKQKSASRTDVEPKERSSDVSPYAPQ